MGSSKSLIAAMARFAAELESLLTRSDRSELAMQVPSLELLSRCGCKDDFCSSFYTRLGELKENLELESEDGLIILDLDSSARILQVEVLYRPDVEAELVAALK